MADFDALAARLEAALVKLRAWEGSASSLTPAPGDNVRSRFLRRAAQLREIVEGLERRRGSGGANGGASLATNEDVAASSSDADTLGNVMAEQMVAAVASEGGITEKVLAAEWLPRLESVDGLAPHNFSRLIEEKLAAHLAGTREWAFSEIFAWLDTATPAECAQLFWTMGGGGTGKSVLTAALLKRVFPRVAAWHFCRHDDPQASSPPALLRSLAAMLWHRLPGYAAALTDVPAESATDPQELFTALFEGPLAKVEAPDKPLLIILDALDELPKESQKSLLGVIAGQLAQLPAWLKLFVTSREEPQITAALAKFKRRELRADEKQNRNDVEAYLRKIARRHVKGEVRSEDIEADVKRQFGIDMQGKLARLQAPMDMSKAVYSVVREKLSAEDGFKELVAQPEKRNGDLAQLSDEFETVYHKQAPEAQAKIMALIAAQWEVDPDKTTLHHPVEGAALPWVEFADSPGVKSEPRSREKMAADYGGHANKLKDLARLTLRFTSCSRMLNALVEELTKANLKVLTLKNKYASPTPMGYSDFNLCVGVLLDDGTEYVCELQLNLAEMLQAKKEAHIYYEEVRTELPALCVGTDVDAGELEAFIVGRLSTSALDAAVGALSAKAEGLFLYAHLLAQHLESEAKDGRTVDFAALDSLPAGLSEVYTVNFRRAFPEGEAGAAWAMARPLIELIAAAREPITEVMAATLLEWDAETKTRVLEATALLFPVRDGKFHVFHKTIVDWLTGEIAEGSSVRERSEQFQVQRKDGHTTFSDGFVDWLKGRYGPTAASAPVPATDGYLLSAVDGPAAGYWLQHGIVHLCRAEGRAAEAAAVYAGDLALLVRRVDAGLLGAVAKDYQELRSCSNVDLDLAAATEMRHFVGKYTDVLHEDGGAVVLQLASQQPDTSAVYGVWSVAPRTAARTLVWRNKPQQADACIATLAHQNIVNALAVSKTRLVVASGKALCVYDAETEELLEQLDGESEVRCVAVTEQAIGASLIVMGDEGGRIKVWDAATLELKGEKTNAHNLKINSVTFSPDGTKIVSACGDYRPGTIKVWDSATLELKSEKPNAHNGYVLSVDFDKNGGKIVSGGEDGTLKVWDSGTLELKATKENAHSGIITSVAFNPMDGKTIVSGSHDRTIKVWDSATLELKTEKSNAHSDVIRSVGFSPDGKAIVSGGADKTIKVWDAATLSLVASQTDSSAGDYGIQSVSYSPDGSKIVSRADSGTIKVWDSATLELKSEKASAHDSRINSVGFSPDGTKICSASGDVFTPGTIKVWDAGTLELKASKEKAHTDTDMFGDAGITSVAYSPVGSKIVSSGKGGTIKVWKLRTKKSWFGHTKSTLELKATKENAHSKVITSVAFNPVDGKTIVSGSMDKTIKVWDSATLELKSEKPNAHNGYVLSVDFDKNGGKIVSGGEDGTLKVWDAATLELTGEKTNAHSDWIRSAAFSPDGKTIVSGSDDKTIKVWDSETLELVEERSGDAATLDRSGEVVERHGATLRLKEGGAFYAPSPLMCVASHWPLLVAGAQSGELYHLQAE